MSILPLKKLKINWDFLKHLNSSKTKRNHFLFLSNIHVHELIAQQDPNQNDFAQSILSK